LNPNDSLRQKLIQLSGIQSAINAEGKRKSEAAHAAVQREQDEQNNKLLDLQSQPQSQSQSQMKS
jgi:hypothetical protein